MSMIYDFEKGEIVEQTEQSKKIILKKDVDAMIVALLLEAKNEVDLKEIQKLAKTVYIKKKIE